MQVNEEDYDIFKKGPNLLIYPGGGDPNHHKYKKVYSNIITEAKNQKF